MRLVLIVLLVVFHSLIIYGGGWEHPEGYVDIPLYGSLAGWTYSFMLESFTFISGYVWLYASLNGGGNLYHLIKKKSKRLLVPMLVFGLLYFICFMEYQTIGGAVYDVLNGAGHLWYLPMLFWCFVEAWILKQIKIDERIKLIGVALLAIFCSEFPIPFRIATSFYYLFFFYLPVLFVGKREVVYKKVMGEPRGILTTAWIAFIAAYLLIKYILHTPLPTEGLPIVNKFMVLSLNKALQLVYSTLGVSAFYLTGVALSGTSDLTAKDTLLVKLGSYCFGVYIFQQFVLKELYYNTNIPGVVGPYLLPWIGVVLALVISFVLTYLIRFTKVGRGLL